MLRPALLIIGGLIAGCDDGKTADASESPPASDTAESSDTGEPHSAAEAVGHPTFMSPHASPIAVHKEHVFVVNTPADTLDVIDSESLEIINRIHVGIDPVSVAVRPDGYEVWVSNHVSDSVSVIDNDPESLTYMQVVATIQAFDPDTRSTRFDEPVAVVFASNQKAYVALSSQNEVAVIDVTTRSVSKTLSITAQDPRAMTVSNGRLYVIPFESGNTTQISGCTDELDGDLCTFDATEHIKVHDQTDGQTDDLVLSLYEHVDVVKVYGAMADRDLFIFDTESDELITTASTLGGLLYGITASPSGQVYIAQTDPRNAENGRASIGDDLFELENRAFSNKITHVECVENTCDMPFLYEFEPLPPLNPAPGDGIATPYAIALTADYSALVASAAGSNRIFTVDPMNGSLLGKVDVGAAPRGIALVPDPEGAPSQAWVLNAADNSVSLIDVSDVTEMRVEATIELDDPTEPGIKRGRRIFHDASMSTSGTYSCDSCHPDGHTDQLIWVLDTPLCGPGIEADAIDDPDKAARAADLNAGCFQIQPRATQPLRGLRDTAPFHWDGTQGDPYGGNNTTSILGDLEPVCCEDDLTSCSVYLVDEALGSTMCSTSDCPTNDEGKPGALSSAERIDLAEFILSIPFPPAQQRPYTNAISPRAKTGFSLFHIEGQDQGGAEKLVCGNCHKMPFLTSTNTQGTGMDAPTWRGAYDRWLILNQGRLNITSVLHSIGALENGIPEKDLWELSWLSDDDFSPIWNMMLEGSTGYSGSFARQVTLSADTYNSEETADLLNALEQSDQEGGIVLQGEGVLIDSGTATAIKLKFEEEAYVEHGGGDQRFTREDLLKHAGEGQFVGTFTARLGTQTTNTDPQPGIWTAGAIQAQIEHPDFPTITNSTPAMTIKGRHIQTGAHILVNGRRVPGEVVCVSGLLPDCDDESILITMETVPEAGMHLLQIQNPEGLFSNDYIFYSQ